MRHPLAAISLAIATLGVAPSAFAVSAACNSFTAGGITLEECAAPFGGTYSLLNQSNQDIHAFAVSTQNTDTSKVFSLNIDWSGYYIAEATWNLQPVNGKSFDATFGAADTGAYFYFTKGLAPILAGTFADGFGFDTGRPASNFIAFNSNYQQIAQSYSASQVSAPVPEPETYAMLLVGLGVIGATVRRRKAA